MRARVHGRQLRSSRRTVPVVLISGVSESAMLTASISVQLGLPDTVAVRHTIDPGRQVLTRVVSDVTGVLEREEIDLEHACVTCAIREDILPTLERLARQGKWGSITACLPVAAEAVQVCRTLAWSPLTAPHVFVAAVVAALDGTSVADDLLGDDLLLERHVATSREDERAVAEVGCALVEYADIVCLTEPPLAEESELIAALARPRVPVITDPSALNAMTLVAGIHQHPAVEAWIAEARRGRLPDLAGTEVWRLDLHSERPFHPDRFQAELSALGGGPRRSRGCFWLPTRPGSVCVWDAAGGQASVGSTERWHPGQRPFTRIVVTGLDDNPQEVRDAFHRCLLTDEELRERGQIWDESWDGLEPWLGPVNRVA